MTRGAVPATLEELVAASTCRRDDDGLVDAEKDPAYAFACHYVPEGCRREAGPLRQGHIPRRPLTTSRSPRPPGLRIPTRRHTPRRPMRLYANACPPALSSLVPCCTSACSLELGVSQLTSTVSQ